MLSVQPADAAQLYVNVKDLFDAAYAELGHPGGNFDEAIERGHGDFVEELASELIRDAVPEGRVEEGDLEVILEVRKTRPKTTKLTRPGPDVDNYAKGVLDALTDSGRVWLDDKQVAHLRVTKRWTQPGETAGVAILIYPFKDT